MAESRLEHAEASEVGYVSEPKGRIFVLRRRLYAEEWPSMHRTFRKCRYRTGSSKSLVARLDRREDHPKTIDRRRHQSVDARVSSIPSGAILAVQQMIELLELPPGWNSYNARPIKKENVNFAVDLLGQTMRVDTPAPNVIPMVRGGVQLEWHTRGIDLEVSIYSPGKFSVVAEDARGGTPAEGALDLASLRQWVERLSR